MWILTMNIFTDKYVQIWFFDSPLPSATASKYVYISVTKHNQHTNNIDHYVYFVWKSLEKLYYEQIILPELHPQNIYYISTCKKNSDNPIRNGYLYGRYKKRLNKKLFRWWHIFPTVYQRK